MHPVRPANVRVLPGDRLNFFPCGSVRRSAQGVESTHIEECIVQAIGEIFLSSNGPTKCLTLQIVLIDGWNFHSASRSTAGQASVIHEYTDRLVGRRVEWDLDLDSTFRPE